MAETDIFKVKKGESTTKAKDRFLKKQKAIDEMIMGEGKGLTMPSSDKFLTKAEKKEKVKKTPKSRLVGKFKKIKKSRGGIINGNDLVASYYDKG